MSFCRRTTDEGTTEFTPLRYWCFHILADLFYADDSVKRTLLLPGRSSAVRALLDVSRHVAPRPATAAYTHRGRLHMLPAFLYNSAPEAEILNEMKDKVCSSMYESELYNVRS